MPERRVALSLGGNIGDVLGAFAFALDRLGRAPRTRLVALSGVYRTSPWGRTDQPGFLNLAALVDTALGPREFLGVCLQIEAQAGRVRGEPWGPRPLDIDIIDFAGERRDEPDLALPHPHAAARAFVLIPLSEIAPDLRLGDQSLRDLAAACAPADAVRDDDATSRLRARLAHVRRG